MARTRTLAQLSAEAYERADEESATDRFPTAALTRYVNQGIAELYDILVEARGRAYYRAAAPWTITTLASTSFYAFAAYVVGATTYDAGTFYKLISIRRSTQNGPMLEPFQPGDEADLRSTSGASTYPTHYEVRPGGIELLPLHAAGTSIVVDYIPHAVELGTVTTFDGINGWEDYVVAFAARCIGTKNADWELVRALDADMARIKERVAKLAPTRDAFRAERANDVRGTMMWRR
jgi:hypothetical protein